MVIIYKGLHRVLHNTCPPNVVGQCQRFLRRHVTILLIYYTPKSYNLPILIQVVFTIALWLKRLDRQSFTTLPLGSKAARANSFLALNQQIERRSLNICSNITILLGRHVWPPGRCFVRGLFKQCFIQLCTAQLPKLAISSCFHAKQLSIYINCNINGFRQIV